MTTLNIERKSNKKNFFIDFWEYEKLCLKNLQVEKHCKDIFWFQEIFFHFYVLKSSLA